jgi:type II secretory pathway component GspD/PulD (secretin)
MKKRISLIPLGLVLCALLTLTTPIPTMAEPGRISIDVRDADIVDVIRLLATESNANIITDNSVKREKITLHLHDLTFKQALDIIARAYDLELRQDKNITIVRAGSSATAIHLRYARSNDVIKHLKGLLPSNDYSSDDKTNTILVTGNEDSIATVRSLIATIDVPTPQVMFEVQVVDIIKNNDNANIGFLFGGLQTNATQTPQQFNYQFTPFIGKTIGLFTQLNAMASHGSAKILATPRIATLNNQEASILIGTQYPIVTTTANSGGSNVNVTYIDVGVKLRVTPTIGSDGSMIADLHPEVSTIDTIVQSAGASAPQISDRRIDATLRVRKDETIVLGGLLRDFDSTTISKLPFLGDIPVFGELFRNRQNTKLKDNVVFLITPHIVR